MPPRTRFWLSLGISPPRNGSNLEVSIGNRVKRGPSRSRSETHEYMWSHDL
jgi:hypothetical protein